MELINEFNKKEIKTLEYLFNKYYSKFTKNNLVHLFLVFVYEKNNYSLDKETFENLIIEYLNEVKEHHQTKIKEK